MSEHWTFYRTKIHNVSDSQKQTMISICNTFRFCYNWAVALYKENLEKQIYMSFFDLTDEFTKFRNLPGNEWLLDYDLNTCRFALANAHQAFENYLNRRTDFPKFKTKKHSKMTFQVRGERIAFFGDDNRYLRIPGLGRSRKGNSLDCKHHRIPVGPDIDYYNTVITYDGKDFWLSLSIKEDKQDPEPDNDD